MTQNISHSSSPSIGDTRFPEPQGIVDPSSKRITKTAIAVTSRSSAQFPSTHSTTTPLNQKKNPAPRTISQNLEPHIAALTKKLHKAIIWNDDERCRLLIEQGAELENKDAKGKTLIQSAIEHKRWNACKVLIDYGATLTSQDCAQMDASLTSLGITESACELYKTPFPQPYVLEVFVNGIFQPLSAIKSQLPVDSSNPLGLMLVADEPMDRDDYPGPALAYDKSGDVLSSSVLAKHLTLMRIRVTTANKLGSSIQQAKEAFPKAQLVFCLLFTHTENDSLEISHHSKLKISDTSIIQEIGKCVDVPGVIVFAGCTTHAMAKETARHTQGLLAFGSLKPINEIEWAYFYPPGFRIHPIFMPIVRSTNDDDSTQHVCAYQMDREFVAEKFLLKEDEKNGRVIPKLCSWIQIPPIPPHIQTMRTMAPMTGTFPIEDVQAFPPPPSPPKSPTEPSQEQLEVMRDLAKLAIQPTAEQQFLLNMYEEIRWFSF